MLDACFGMPYLPSFFPRSLSTPFSPCIINVVIFRVMSFSVLKDERYKRRFGSILRSCVNAEDLTFFSSYRYRGAILTLI